MIKQQEWPKDDMGTPLLYSGVGERIWGLYQSDPNEFKREVRKYFDRGYPGWAVVRANYLQRVIWLRDERR